MNHVNEVREFIITNFLFGDAATLHNDTSFLESSIVDSTGILELILFLEQRYGIKVTEQETIPENLDSVTKVAKFIDRKLADAKAA
ncbi:MAG TPA: acyl carrier protein [Verrucomicrobiota bacterium]|nr:acyl carrier protein [Verrucomicrobiota bacterium]HNT15559.1 acyl carrier protein [Verrucomicrobiota bacterium]